MKDAASFALNENRAVSDSGNSSDRLVFGGFVSLGGLEDALSVSLGGLEDALSESPEGLGALLGCDGLVEGCGVPGLGEPVDRPGVVSGGGVRSFVGDGDGDVRGTGAFELLAAGVRPSDPGS